MHLLHHTCLLNRADTGSITILWSQPVGGLQILAPGGKWKWVKHIDNGLVRSQTLP
jgi:isopenicillin N synthase-like dioxygenase